MNKTSTSASNNIRPAILMIVLLLIEMKILDYLFPFPGFKAIISLPIIYGICSVVIIFGIFLTKKLNIKSRTVIWFIIFVFNSLVAVQFYPQDGGPTVLKQIRYSYNVINNYETISEEDLELYIENEYDPFDKSVPDDEERYVAALYRFRNEINRDGSNFIYGRKNEPILENTNIKKHLKTGKDKLIWRILETLKEDK